MKWGQGLAVGLMGAVLGGGAMLVAAPATVSAPERARIEQVVRDYILRNPEIIQEAALKLQSREVGKLVSANRAAFETPYKNAFAGNPRGDVTLVEFFDYACGYCRQSVAVIDRLLAEDKNLRVVYREFPVLGPDSDAAARASLAAAAVSSARYNAFHHALFAAGRPEPATLARVAAAQGVSMAGTPEINAELSANAQLAAAIGVRGTPAFIVGEEIFPGAVAYETLKQAIADVRAARR
ncbi:MAG TPA: DsbA family protein [Sphingomonadaceae bacterium]|nr:DsbA family protein [Sphingomonadaceae bacterium]